jgi:hypothetical protein
MLQKVSSCVDIPFASFGRFASGCVSSVAMATPSYLVSRWAVCFRSCRQNFFSSSFSVIVFLFFVVV